MKIFLEFEEALVLQEVLEDLIKNNLPQIGSHAYINAIIQELKSTIEAEKTKKEAW